jgi:predicted nucleic acid-binding protein
VIVVDASVLAPALLDDGPKGALFRTALAADSHWAAPTHLHIEVTSVVRGLVLAGKAKATRGAQVIEALASLTVDLVDVPRLLPRIWALRDNLTAYDAAYVATAEMLGCPLLTADARLAGAPGAACTIRLVAP